MTLVADKDYSRDVDKSRLFDTREWRLTLLGGD